MQIVAAVDDADDDDVRCRSFAMDHSSYSLVAVDDDAVAAANASYQPLKTMTMVTVPFFPIHSIRPNRRRRQIHLQKKRIKQKQNASPFPPAGDSFGFFDDGSSITSADIVSSSIIFPSFFVHKNNRSHSFSHNKNRRRRFK